MNDINEKATLAGFVTKTAARRIHQNRLKANDAYRQKYQQQLTLRRQQLQKKRAKQPFVSKVKAKLRQSRLAKTVRSVRRYDPVKKFKRRIENKARSFARKQIYRFVDAATRTESIEPKSVYHVTLTKNIDNIKKKGLLPFQNTNWVQAGNKERYGSGETYAFEHEHDAHRWAAKWDWDLHKKFGTGKISVIKMNPSVNWETDKADPLGQAGAKGKWLKHFGRIESKHIQSITPFTPEHARALIK